MRLSSFTFVISIVWQQQHAAAWSPSWWQAGRSATSRRRTVKIRQNNENHQSYHMRPTRSTSLLSSNPNDNNINTSNNIPTINSSNGELERLKKEEQRLFALLDSIRKQKLVVLRSRPLSIGIIGFGRFGQFISKTLTKYGNVVVTSKTDYANVASEMGVKYMPLSELESFVLDENLDVIILSTSIVSFKDTVMDLLPHLEKKMQLKGGANSCPLIVDVASVKEHPRNILLDLLPEECDVLCTHPMFGPDSARDGWRGRTFVYEKTRINKVILDPYYHEGGEENQLENTEASFVDGMDRMERFLSIWEEEGCNMIPLSCSDHDSYSANSQFITHLVGRILGVQGLKATPIDTTGFQSVLRLIETTNADSFDLFYGLYKYNRNSGYTIGRLRGALDDVVGALLQRDGVVGVFDGGNRKNDVDTK